MSLTLSPFLNSELERTAQIPNDTVVEYRSYRLLLTYLKTLTLAGAGDVVGPASATDNAIARYDTTTGKLIQNSLATISDTGSMNIPAGQQYLINGVPIGGSGLSPSGSDVGATASAQEFTFGVTVTAAGVSNLAITSTGIALSDLVSHDEAYFNTSVGVYARNSTSGSQALLAPNGTATLTNAAAATLVLSATAITGSAGLDLSGTVGLVKLPTGALNNESIGWAAGRGMYDLTTGIGFSVGAQLSFRVNSRAVQFEQVKTITPASTLNIGDVGGSEAGMSMKIDNTASGLISLGDTSGSVNGTVFSLDDTNKIFDFQYNAGGKITVNGADTYTGTVAGAAGKSVVNGLIMN